MAFQIKGFNSIVASMVGYFSGVTNRITDFNIGGVTRTIFESVALEVEQIYIRLWEGLVEATETSVYKTFDFPKLTPAKAGGILEFSRTTPAPSDITIPAGTQAKVPSLDKTFATTVTTTITTGNQTAQAASEATAAGSAKNTAANTITEIVTPVVGVEAVTNPLAFRNGTDLETNEGRRLRFREYVKNLPRGTLDAIEYGSKTTIIYDTDGYTILERVVDAHVEESAGTVDVYIWNGTGSTSSDLVDLCQTILDGYVNEDGVYIQGYRCAGIVTNVSAASEVTQNIVAVVTIEDGFDSTTVKTNVEDALNDYFDSLGVGDDILYTQLITTAQNEDGVVDINFTTPATDVTINYDEVAVIGTVTLT